MHLSIDITGAPPPLNLIIAETKSPNNQTACAIRAGVTPPTRRSKPFGIDACFDAVLPRVMAFSKKSRVRTHSGGDLEELAAWPRNDSSNGNANRGKQTTWITAHPPPITSR